MNDQQDIIVQAKLVVLGDTGTGKSALIRNLSRLNHSQSSKNDLNLIVFSKSDLDQYLNCVYLKPWEHPTNHGMNKNEEELALACTLICVITVDLRSPSSANSAFSKWMQLKETFMPDAFLIIVGTFLDSMTLRRININEICKACSLKDALYLEVSNTSEITNMSLLKELIARKIIYTLKLGEKIRLSSSNSSSNPALVHEEILDDDFISREEKSNIDENLNPKKLSNLHIPFLEPEILYSSIGSIFTSSIGTNIWTGTTNVSTSNEHTLAYSTTGNVTDGNKGILNPSSPNMSEIGKRISDYIDMISSTIDESDPSYSSPPPALGDGMPILSPMTFTDSEDTLHNTNNNNNDFYQDIEQLKHIFEVIGFTPSTKALTQMQITVDNPNHTLSPNPSQYQQQHQYQYPPAPDTSRPRPPLSMKDTLPPSPPTPMPIHIPMHIPISIPISTQHPHGLGQGPGPMIPSTNLSSEISSNIAIHTHSHVHTTRKPHSTPNHDNKPNNKHKSPAASPSPAVPVSVPVHVLTQLHTQLHTHINVQPNQQSRTTQMHSHSNHSHRGEKPLKMRIKLLDGSFSDLHVYTSIDVEPQVDSFLKQHGMERDNSNAKGKIIENIHRMMSASTDVHKSKTGRQSNNSNVHGGGVTSNLKRIEETNEDTDADSNSSVASSSYSTNPSISSSVASAVSKPIKPSPMAGSLRAKKKRKVRVVLPGKEKDRESGAGGSVVEVVVEAGDDILALTVQMAERYDLTQDFQKKVFDVLVSACC